MPQPILIDSSLFPELEKREVDPARRPRHCRASGNLGGDWWANGVCLSLVHINLIAGNHFCSPVAILQ